MYKDVLVAAVKEAVGLLRENIGFDFIYNDDAKNTERYETVIEVREDGTVHEMH